MFGKSKMPEDVKLYQQTSVSASDDYAKFKATGKKKFQKRAKADYAAVHALELKMTHPGTVVDNKTLTINKSKQKSTTVNVNASLGINTPKRIKPKK